MESFMMCSNYGIVLESICLVIYNVLRRAFGRVKGGFLNTRYGLTMNQDKQFLKYVPVQGEKYLGIAIVRWFGKIILRYKVMQSQDGQGYWVAAGSAKIGKKRDGSDNYEEWFQLDSSYDREEMKEFILMNVEPILAQKQASVFAPPPQYSAHAQQPQQQAPNQQNYSNQGQGQNYNASSDPWGQPPF